MARYYREGADLETPSVPAPTQMDTLQAMLEEGGMDLLTEEEQQWLFPQEEEADRTEFYANLAETVEESELKRISSDITEWVQWDEASRETWQDREKKGILLLGVTEEVEGGASFDGASKCVHPLLIEACTQFQARAIAELFPASGPVKTRVLGEVNPDLNSQAERVQDYMNYQYTQEMPSAFDEMDRLLFRLPLSGSCFKHVFFDPLEGVVSTRFVEPSYFLVPYSATSLRTAPRYTLFIDYAHNDLLRLMHSGYYRKVDLIESYWRDDDNPVLDAIDDAEGKEETHYEDAPHRLYECHCYLDLKGYEDQDESGKETGISLPYIVTIDKDTEQVLAIRRNWKEGDPLKRKRIWFSHYKFLPGLGFYGFGFIHALGGLSRAATGALRALLDAAQFANMAGGFRSKDAGIDRGEVTVGPGEWVEVDATAEDLSKCFFKIPYEEPSQTLYNLLGLLDTLGRRFAGTTEASVGEARNTGPVGTTLALIEQGQKVFSGIHKRCHVSQMEEFRIVAELNSLHLPEHYPYAVPEAAKVVSYLDFDDRVDVIPVSDPNISSATQRLAQAQAVMELSATAPDLFDRRTVYMDMLKAMRIPNVAQLMPDRSQVARSDPVMEGARLLRGDPIQAYPDQAHEAHIAVHLSQMEQAARTPMEKAVQGPMMAHLGEHYAFAYLIRMSQAAQVPFLEMGEVPPEVENQVAMMAAQAVQVLQQEQAAASEFSSPEAKELQLQAKIAQAEQARKDAETLAKIRRDDAKSMAKINRDRFVTGHKLGQQIVDKQLEAEELMNRYGVNSSERT